MRTCSTLTLFAAAGIAVAAGFTSNLSARVWTSGRYSLEAEYVTTTEDGNVRLRTPNGTEVEIPRQKLSENDREFLEREFESPFKVVKPAGESPFREVPREGAEGRRFPEREQMRDREPGRDRDGGREREVPRVSVNPSAPVSPVPGRAVVKPGEKAGDRMIKNINGVEFAFRWCPAGAFKMGSPMEEARREKNEIQHEVILSQGFWMLETEVTQGQYAAFMKLPPMPEGAASLPKVGVSWEEASKFCQEIGNLWDVRAALPTEAQWEYACRAGTVTPFSFGNALNGDKAVCDGEEPYGMTERGVELRGPAMVRSKDANAWGLYDMHGNVSEWCADWYASRLGEASVTDPNGPASGNERVVRGGSWDEDAEDCRSAARDEESPRERDSDRGFRFIIQ